MSKPDIYARHELLDRTSILSETFDRYVLETGALEAYPELKAQAERVSEALAEMYQAFGDEFLTDERETCECNPGCAFDPDHFGPCRAVSGGLI